MADISNKDYFQAGYFATQVATYYSKQEIVKLLEQDMLPPVKKVHADIIKKLENQHDTYDNQLQQAIQLVSSIPLELPHLPDDAFDYFYWLDLYHRDIMSHLENDSTEELVFFYGYDYGYTYSHCEILRFITELQVKLPMLLSYNRQTDHILRKLSGTQHRLEATAVRLGHTTGVYVLWEQWKKIDALIKEARDMSYMNVEHAVVLQQERRLGDIVLQLKEAGNYIQRSLK